MAEWPEFSPQDLIRTVVAHGVDFVVVGGLAAVLLGSTRVTQDLDVCYSAEPANLKVLGQALVELDAKLFGIEEDVPFVPDADTLARTEVLTLSTRLGKLDLLRAPGGAPPYPKLRANAELFEVGQIAFPVASTADLIAMKRSAGRAKDIADIEELEAIEDLRRRAPGS